MRGPVAMRLMVCCACLFFLACRDGVAPFTPAPRLTGPDSPHQLTFNPSPDLNPTWSAGSDTVFYTAVKLVDYPEVPNTMVRIARAGGVTQLIAPDANPSKSNSLVLPVLSPKHDRIAYVRLGFVNEPAQCTFAPINTECLASEPLLETGSLRVRAVGSTTTTNQDPTVDIPFKGVDPLRNLGSPDPLNERAFPFQRAYLTSSEMLFRASWSPDGARLVFSDGLELHIWDGSSTTAPLVPNTDDGVSAAWSPDGSQIAFTRLLRTDSSLITCVCHYSIGTTGPAQRHSRWLYVMRHAFLTVINPNGSGAQVIAEGNDPAWSPDGKWIYYSFDANIYRISPHGGIPELIPQTLFGRTPSVSPDGNWLAFVKYSPDEKNSDVWVIRLVTT